MRAITVLISCLRPSLSAELPFQAMDLALGFALLDSIVTGFSLVTWVKLFSANQQIIARMIFLPLAQFSEAYRGSLQEHSGGNITNLDLDN